MCSTSCAMRIHFEPLEGRVCPSARCRGPKLHGCKDFQGSRRGKRSGWNEESRNAMFFLSRNELGCFDMSGINILTLLKQESQSDSGRLLPGGNGRKIDKFPGKDLIPIKSRFLMENHPRHRVPSAGFQEGPGSPACQAPKSFPSREGKQSCLILPGKGRDVG